MLSDHRYRAPIVSSHCVICCLSSSESDHTSSCGATCLEAMLSWLRRMGNCLKTPGTADDISLLRDSNATNSNSVEQLEQQPPYVQVLTFLSKYLIPLRDDLQKKKRVKNRTLSLFLLTPTLLP